MPDLSDVPAPAPFDAPLLPSGGATFDSPLIGTAFAFAQTDRRVRVDPLTFENGVALAPPQASEPEHGSSAVPSFEPAGPHRSIHFDPAEVVAGIVTCGGLCPGLNDVIRSLCETLNERYGVRAVKGFQYGYNGLGPEPWAEPVTLDHAAVDRINDFGGTILGTSRGPEDPGDMVDSLIRHGIRILFCVGGDGTMKGANELAAEVARRRLDIAIVGIPKTIDNDLLWTDRSFGFATAVGEAARVLNGAHAEAISAWNGVGLVKLMGRYSGFIAAHAALASSDVNFCLVPEAPFEMDGPSGLLATLDRRLDRRRHALIVVAEGAGQHLIDDDTVRLDRSGNRKLADIGTWLRDRIAHHFEATGRIGTIKYLDPSYTIRSLPANAFDSEFSVLLAQQAAHVAMAGRTACCVTSWNGRFVVVPLSMMVQGRRQIDPESEEWQRVLMATGQPALG